MQNSLKLYVSPDEACDDKTFTEFYEVDEAGAAAGARPFLPSFAARAQRPFSSFSAAARPKDR